MYIVCISLFSVCGSPVPLILCAPSVFVFCVHCLVFFVWPHGIELCMPDTSLILCAPLCLNVFLRAQPLWLSREPSLLPRDLSGGCCGHCGCCCCKATTEVVWKLWLLGVLGLPLGSFLDFIGSLQL